MNAPYLTQTVSHAAGLMFRILASNQATDGLFASYFRAHPKLGKQDRARVVDRCMEGFRYLGLFQGEAAQWMQDPHREARSSFPPDWQAALSAWLMALTKFPPSNSPAVGAPANLPSWLWLSLCQQEGEERARQLSNAYQRRAPMDIRVHPWRNKVAAVQAELSQAGFVVQPLPSAPFGLRLTVNPDRAEKMPSLHQQACLENGTIALQDIGSQWICQALPLKGRGGMWVDYCAGGGGKTLGLMARLMSVKPTGVSPLLLSADVSTERLARMQARIALATQGRNIGINGTSLVLPVEGRGAQSRLSAVQVVAKRFAGRADGVLVDSPCTGLGTLRRAPELAWRITPSQIVEHGNQQRQIIRSAADWVREGGSLLYATCSWRTEENQAVIDEFLAEHPGFVREPLPSALSALVSEEMPIGQVAVNPLTHDSDGYFFALLKRNA